MVCRLKDNVMKNKSIKYIFMPFLLAVAFLTAASFSATPGYESDTIDTETSQTANVSIKLFTFNPKVLEVTAGTTVVWTNGDAIEHSVTNGTPERPRSDFDSDFSRKVKLIHSNSQKPASTSIFASVIILCRA